MRNSLEKKPKNYKRFFRRQLDIASPKGFKSLFVVFALHKCPETVDVKWFEATRRKGKDRREGGKDRRERGREERIGEREGGRKG